RRHTRSDRDWSSDVCSSDLPCSLCGARESEPVWSTPDRAFAVPGVYTVVRCVACGFLYQRPRVRDENLAECYPDHYPRHQEPSPDRKSTRLNSSHDQISYAV